MARPVKASWARFMLLPLSSSREARLFGVNFFEELAEPHDQFCQRLLVAAARGESQSATRRETRVIRHEIAPCPASGEHLALYLPEVRLWAFADRQAQIVNVRRRVRAFDFEQAVVADQPVRRCASGHAFDTDKPGFVNQPPRADLIQRTGIRFALSAYQHGAVAVRLDGLSGKSLAHKLRPVVAAIR